MADNRNDYTAQKVITSPVAQKVRKAIDSAQKAHLRPALRDGVRGSDNTALSRTFFDRPVPPQQRVQTGRVRAQDRSSSRAGSNRGAAAGTRPPHGAVPPLPGYGCHPVPGGAHRAEQEGKSAGRHRDYRCTVPSSHICGDSPWDGLSMARSAWHFSSDIPACSWQ